MGKLLHFTISIPAALVAVALLLLNGREIAGAALQNAAALRLLAPWQEVTADPSSLLACPPGSPGPAADALMKAALRLRPETGSAWLLQGRSAWLAGRCSEAREAWRRAVALAPQNRAAWLLYLLIGPPDLLPEPTVAEGVANYLAFLGDQARSAERWEEALRWYERSFSLAPDVPTASRLEAVYLKLERKEEAVARWEELAAHLLPSDPGHWWALGRAAELSEDFEYAEEAYRKAVEVQPDLFWLYLNVGHVRRIQGDYCGALAWYQKAEALAPDQFEPKFWVGLAQYLRGEDRAAEEALRAALEMNPQYVWSAYYLAQSLYRQGRREEAISWLRTAIGLYKGQPWDWAVQLGGWLAEAGDREGALAAYRQALEWKPGDEGIAAKIRALEGK
jgi:tetratricopeptide (TPR) repeat protein